MNLIFIVIACGTDDSLDATGAVDLRLSPDDFPADDATHAQWWGPEVRVEPGEDKMFCLFGTYEGPDQGVHSLVTYQNTYGHHLQLMATTASDIDYPDGTVIDCTDTGSLNMADIRPIVIATGGFVGGEELLGGMEMPEGMAVKLYGDSRWVMQAHYINSGTEPMLAHDVALAEYMDPATVEPWAAPIVANQGDFLIPAGESATVSFDCSYRQEWTVMYVLGHMHEWGSAFLLEEVTDDVVTPIVDIPEWLPEYRDAAPITRFEAGTHILSERTTLRTTCSWFNDTDTDLEFPHEMCVGVGLVYPQLTTVICDGGDVE